MDVLSGEYSITALPLNKKTGQLCYYYGMETTS